MSEYRGDMQFRTSTPVRTNSQSHPVGGRNFKSNVGGNVTRTPTRDRAELELQVEELQRNLSKATLENEEYMYELNLAREKINQLQEENEQLAAANEELTRVIEEKDEYQSRVRLKLKEQVDSVTNMAVAVYNSLVAFKTKYYREQQYLSEGSYS